ncbi:TfoX/Sxy family protein [Methylobacillus glycogenes]|uniref:TfoX/Sxy family protein n=1 Tax=Methylobacillus glycogenes TaxID=406 RepID=UPI0004711F6C|nr:TfoX/Sxy family protein [Methylobacillus glycogenes]MBL8505635.1 TfoX/Sxy family protein [Methylobacillus glycogenes]
MNEFVEYLHELLHDFGPIQAKKMFGGYGIYHQGLMFGLVADDTLYLKSDDESRPQFEAMQLPAFRYQRQGKEITMSFHQAPADMLEQADEATHWARLAYAAALRSKQRK